MFDEYRADYTIPELEHGELDRRLRRLAWPGPPAEARERCLERIMGAVQTHLEAEVESTPPRVERVQRYELTRWRPLARPARLQAPRRQPRFATAL
jgi:hypothetical protein